jgi:DNA repair exonuclease SbcCD ATPase subunit
MTMLKRFGCFSFLSFVLFSLAYLPPVQAQTRRAAESAGQETATQELVSEVRLLRQALEQNQKLLLRLFSITERLRAQHEVLLQVTRDLDDVRRQLGEMKINPTQAAEQLAEMEKKFETGVIPNTQYQRFRAEVEQQTQWERELRIRESELTSQLKSERAKLNELNQRLEALEREITR